MTDADRDSVLRFVKDFAAKDETPVAGTNAPSTVGVIANTARARAIGYDTVLLAVPFHSKPTQAEIIRHFSAVLDAVDVNSVLCSYPAKDGVEIGQEALDEGPLQAGHRPCRPLHRAGRPDRDRRWCRLCPVRPHHRGHPVQRPPDRSRRGRDCRRCAFRPTGKNPGRADPA
jgi:hypothetical protein